MDYWTLRTSWESFNIIAKLNLCFKGLLPKLHGLTHYFYDCQYECPFITVTRIMSAWWLCPISDPTYVCLIMQEMRKTLFGKTTYENKQISKIMILDQPKLLRAPLQIHLWMELLDITVTQDQCINVYINLFASIFKFSFWNIHCFQRIRFCHICNMWRGG